MLRVASCFAFIAAALFLLPGSQAKEEWLPITAEELAMKDNPAEPGAQAMLLYREVMSNDADSYETHYYRIKILSEEGKKWGDVEIPFVKDLFRISDIKARTIRPDGSVVPFDGKVYEKLVVKTKGLRYLARIFTLPEVHRGSIIEYKYRRGWSQYLLFATNWTIQDQLFTRKINLRLRPYTGRRMYWMALNPKGYAPKEEKDGTWSLQAENIPSFQEEPWMPPKSTYKWRLHFFYSLRDLEKTPEEFWKREGKEWYQTVEPFIGNRGKIRSAATTLVAANDSPEIKLRKIYARVQQVRNLSFEREKTEKEEKREKLKENNNVEDVLEHGYGYRNEINRLFVAMARAVGVEAQVVRIARRDEVFFNPKMMDADQLNSEVVVVRLGNQDLYFDPGTRFCPFGLLSWPRTGVQGIRLDKQGGVFVSTPNSLSKEAVTERRASLKMDEDGSVEGTVQISFTGLEALRWRLDALDTDEQGRRQELEDEIRKGLPAGTVLELTKITGWESSEEPLRAEGTVRIPGLGTFTGRRLLLPLGVFQVSDTNPFRHASRKYPVYFPYPFQEVDDITLELPESYRVEHLPGEHQTPAAFGSYAMRAERRGGGVNIRRSFIMEGIFFRTEYYPALQQFFGSVRNSDEDQMVVQVEMGRR